MKNKRRDCFASLTMTKWCCHCEADEVSRSNPKIGSDMGNVAMKKKRRDCFAMLAMTSGITAVPLIIALVFMISLGTFFNSLLLGKHAGAPLLAKTTKALYITEAGIEFTDEYLLLGYKDVDWTTVTDISPTSFGGGTFAVAFTNKTQDTVTATATGTIANAVRVITIDFERKHVLESNPITYIAPGPTGYEENPPGGATILCSDGNPCGPPPAICSCTYNPGNPDEEAPPPIPPEGVTWLDASLPGDCGSIPGINPGINPDECVFTAGTYYFDNLIIGEGNHVTVSGHVTIWILNTFDMRQGSTFNFFSPYGVGDYGDSANVLLLSAADGTLFWLRQNNKFSGAIYAPNATIDMKNSDMFVGAIVGGTILIRNFATITFDPDAGSELIAAGSQPPKTVITASGWEEI